MNNWKETTLGEVAELQRGFDLPTQNRIKGHYPIMVSNGQDGTHHQYKVKGPGIITGRSGTIGSVFYVKENFWPLNTTLWVKNYHGNNIKFVYYLFKTIPFEKFNTGSGVPTLNRNYIHPFPVLLPPTEEQKEIAGVLSSLDDKIELLREENKTLEETVQTLFKEWFVNFNFPDKNGKPYKSSGGKMIDYELGEIPEGWKASRLTEIAEFLNGLAMQKFPPENPKEYLSVIKIKELNSGISDQTDKVSSKVDKKYIIENGDVLFSWSGSLAIDIWKYGRGVLNQHLFKVSSQIYPKWFYLYWLKIHLASFQQIAGAKAVTMGHIQRHHLDDALVVIADENFMDLADKTFSPILEKFIDNNSQIQTLSATRDTLLPKLMSGKIRVNSH